MYVEISVSKIDGNDKRKLNTSVIVSRKSLSVIWIPSASIVYLQNQNNFPTCDIENEYMCI